LLGENVNAHIKLTHKSKYEVQASTLMKIEGWTS
jgi:hypothetical protein